MKPLVNSLIQTQNKLPEKAKQGKQYCYICNKELIERYVHNTILYECPDHDEEEIYSFWWMTDGGLGV